MTSRFFYQPLTLGLIIISIVISLYGGLGTSLQNITILFISEYFVNGAGFLYEVRDGQWWRLITPMFIHLGILHLLFNMLWLWQLGNVLEMFLGKLRFISMVLITALVSNLAEYFVTGPAFGGMSGVVYGLLVYIWIRNSLDRRFVIALPKEIVAMMLIWYVLCWTGLLGNIANYAHTMGMISGGIFALLDSFAGSRPKRTAA